MIELGLTLLSCGMVMGLGAISVVVLPWTDDELAHSTAAFVGIPGAIRAAAHGIAGAAAPRRTPAAVPARI